MSETTLPKDDLQSALDAPTQTPAVTVQRSGNALAIIAVLLGVTAIAAVGWGVWQVHNLQSGHQQQSLQMDALSAQAQALKEGEQQLTARLAQLPEASELEDRRRLVVQLQGDQQRLSQRLETVLGASRKDWRLAEAEHLLRLASLRLSALQDIGSAQALVEGADEILREQNDPGAFAAREQVAKSLAALHGVEQPDRTGLFLQLAALRDEVVQLNARAPEFQDKGESLFGLTTGSDHSSRWAQWWDTISKYIRIDFNANKNIRPMLAGQSLDQVRLTLSLTLEQAQWAALNGETKVYGLALGEAKNVLMENFSQDNPQSKAMLDRIAELATQPVSVVTPDLANSLNAVQAYLERRQLPADDGKAQSIQEISP